jgi:hypothetical protein
VNCVRAATISRIGKRSGEALPLAGHAIASGMRLNRKNAAYCLWKLNTAVVNKAGFVPSSAPCNKEFPQERI